jgi:hypothetical protein
VDAPDVTATSLAEFVAAISDTYEEDRFLFRGQADETWPLWPGICRVVTTSDTLRRGEQQMIGEFKRLALPYLQRVPPDEWQWLALAQHHGIPTRLLDWTSNPLAALFFAVAEQAACDSAVWCYRYRRSQRVEHLNPYEIEEVHVFRPPHNSARIGGQAGFFTAHPIPLRPFWARPDTGETLTRILIQRTDRPRLRNELNRVGINYASLFPDLDGLSRHIRWFNTVLKDELPVRERVSDSTRATVDSLAK